MGGSRKTGGPKPYQPPRPNGSSGWVRNPGRGGGAGSTPYQPPPRDCWGSGVQPPARKTGRGTGRCRSVTWLWCRIRRRCGRTAARGRNEKKRGWVTEASSAIIRYKILLYTKTFMWRKVIFFKFGGNKRFRIRNDRFLKKGKLHGNVKRCAVGALRPVAGMKKEGVRRQRRSSGTKECSMRKRLCGKPKVLPFGENKRFRIRNNRLCAVQSRKKNLPFWHAAYTLPYCVVLRGFPPH